jgi:hypothetical protein
MEYRFSKLILMVWMRIRGSNLPCRSIAPSDLLFGVCLDVSFAQLPFLLA